MKNDFYQSLDSSNQQLVNKLKLFVAANTFLKVSHQPSFIKFSYKLNDPSLFYIGKGPDEELYIKFREKPLISRNFPGDKVLLSKFMDKIMKYIKEEYGAVKQKEIEPISKPKAIKQGVSQGFFKELISKFSQPKSDLEIDQKFEDIFAFILDSFQDLSHDEDYPIGFWFEKTGKTILKLEKDPNDSSVFFVINFFNPHNKDLYLPNPIVVDSETNVGQSTQIIYDHLDNNQKFLKKDTLSYDEATNITYKNNNEELIDLEKTDLLINKKVINPRKLFLSNRFKKSISAEDKETVKKVYQILEEIENAPIGSEFLRFIKRYQINKIYDLYKIRVDDEKRIVFQYFHSQGYSGMKIVDFIPDHKFDYLKDIKLERITYTLWTSSKNDSVSKIPLLSENQKEIVFNKDFPSFVFGAAGSGKTSISLEKYLSIFNQLTEQQSNPITKSDLLYLTFNPKVAIDIENQIRLFYSNPNVMTVDNFFIELLGYTVTRILSYEDFEIWFDVNYLKAFDQKSRLIGSTIDSSNPAIFAYTYYRGVFKGSLGHEIDKFWITNHLPKEIFIDYLLSENIKLDQINALWDVFINYERHISDNRLMHDNDLAYEVLKNLHSIEQRFDSIIIDETQDLTQLQLFTIVKLSKDMKIYFYGDANQTINPTIFSLGKLNQIIYKLSNNRIKIDNPYILNKTYRASKGLVEYTNQLVDLRKKWIASQGEEIDYHHETFDEDGDVRWATRVHRQELIDYVVEKTLNNPNAIILVPNHKVKQYLLNLNKINDENQNRIYTIYEAKGLEWESVILYKFIGTDLNKFIEMNNGKAEKSTFHRMVFNKYYVACTRARRTSIIIESANDAAKIESLFDTIHEVKEKSLLENYFNNNNTPEAWLNEAVNLFSQFEYRKARISYEKSIDLDSDRIFELIEICNELEKASNDIKFDLSSEIVLKLKMKKEFDHLINYYRRKGMKYHIKLLQMYKGDNLEKEEILEILREIELDSNDLDFLKESGFVKDLLQKEIELKQEIRSVIT